MPPVRLAPRDELAAAARVAPLLRAARGLSAWIAEHPAVADRQVLDGPAASAAADALDLTPDELDAAWQIVDAAARRGATRHGATQRGATQHGSTQHGSTQHGAIQHGAIQHGALQEEAGRPRAARRGAAPGGLAQEQPDDAEPTAVPLAAASAEDVLHEWDDALAALLAAEELDGLATALYTVGAPVRIDALFEAYAAAAGTSREPAAGEQNGQPTGQSQDPDQAAALSHALETLADLGVVELGTEEHTGGLTVVLSPLGVWGVHRRLLAQGWHAPVLGTAERDGAVGLLMTLASCDAEDGESKISEWLVGRSEKDATAELIAAAAAGTPGLRGAAFAVLDRIGPAAAPEVRAALSEPLLRAHAAVWLHEHGEEAELGPEDRTWLLVDLGAGLLEEADPRDVVAELLPQVPSESQAEIVAGLWQVRHPGVIDLLTTLSEHHPDPSVARAARKAAFKARSPGAGGGQRGQ